VTHPHDCPGCIAECPEHGNIVATERVATIEFLDEFFDARKNRFNLKYRLVRLEDMRKLLRMIQAGVHVSNRRDAALEELKR
jgi:hypothetical protein